MPAQDGVGLDDGPSFMDLVGRLNADPEVDGILVQLPLPAAIDAGRIIERIDPAKDVDGFHPESVGHLWLDEAGFVPATPCGILEMLRSYSAASTAEDLSFRSSSRRS